MAGEIVIVTGGAKGVGRYIAHTFAKEGAKVALADVDVERMERTAAELRALGADGLAVPTDVRNEDAVRAMVDRVASEYGRIDVLVNDAGIVPHFAWGVPRWPRIRDMELGFWSRVMETNLGGTFLCTKHVLPRMEAQRSGHVVNLYGGGAPTSSGGACVYVVSKEAIRVFTQYVAEEAREANVCVVAVNPGAAIATEDAPEEARQRMPGPEFVENRFVLAARAGMDLSGKLLTLQDGRLVVEE